MAMKTLYLKEHGGFANNPIGQLSSVPSVTWWGAFGPHSGYGESGLKHLSMDQTTAELSATKQVDCRSEQGLGKGKITQITTFPDDGRKPPQPALSLQTGLPEYRGHLDLGFSQPMVCAKHPHMDQCYRLFSAYGPEIPGRIMLPMSLATDDGPIFVNPKQYHGIIRRRKSRAKAVVENKLSRNRKPYMHYSRHLHAMRRPRGNGGRFLNAKKDTGEKGTEVENFGDIQLSQPAGSQSSEVLHSDSGTLNSTKEANDGVSNLSGSEVTSVYSRGDIEQFQVNHLFPPLHYFAGMMSTGHGNVMPSKWVAAADNCCNLKA